MEQDDITVTHLAFPRRGGLVVGLQSWGTSLFCATLTCSGIPLGLLMGHLPEGGQPQWGCAA